MKDPTLWFGLPCSHLKNVDGLKNTNVGFKDVTAFATVDIRIRVVGVVPSDHAPHNSFAVSATCAKWMPTWKDTRERGNNFITNRIVGSLSMTVARAKSWVVKMWVTFVVGNQLLATTTQSKPTKDINWAWCGPMDSCQHILSFFCFLPPLEGNLSNSTIRCNLSIPTRGKKVCRSNRFGCIVESSGHGFGRIDGQKPPVDNWNDLFMHFLATSLNRQVCNKWLEWTGFIF